MRIVVLGDKCFHYTTSVAKAFERLGHNVKLIYVKQFNREDLTFREYVKYKLNKKKFVEKYYNEQKDDYWNNIFDSHVDLFININANYYFEIVDAKHIEELRKRGVRIITWYMDSIRRCEHISQNIEYYDRVFVFEPADIFYLKKSYKTVKIKYLPIGVAKEIFGLKEHFEKKYDISFVGSKTKNRLEILETIASYCIQERKAMIVYGKYYEDKGCLLRRFFSKLKFKYQYPCLFKFITNKTLNGKSISELYNKSRISLNIHINIHKGINPRTFEILAGGNFELCDYRKNSNRLGLIDNYNIVFYKNNSDCIKKIDYYLRDTEKREEISKEGYRLIKEKYYMDTILNHFLRYCTK